MIAQILCGQIDSTVVVKDGAGNTELSLDCKNPATTVPSRVTLTATYPSLTSTESYTISAISSMPPSYNDGTPLNFTSADNNKFARKIDIGFSFDFFCKTYTQLVIGANGVVTFDISQFGNKNFPSFNQTNYDPLLPQRSIGGVMQALNFDATNGADVYYKLSGVAPYRTLTISYYNVKMLYNGGTASCNSLRTTSQIVLHETTNEIEVFIDKKPLPCPDGDFQNSLLGLVSDTSANKGFSPPGRNTGVWQATGEGWKFSPIPITPTLIWKDANNRYLGNSNPVTVPVVAGPQTYTAYVTYNFCNKNKVLQGSYKINFFPDTPINKNLSLNITTCDKGGDNYEPYDWNAQFDSQITTDPNYKITYYESEAAALVGGTGLSGIHPGDYSVYFRVENKTTHCFSIGSKIKVHADLFINIKAKDGEVAHCFDGAQDYIYDLQEAINPLLFSYIRSNMLVDPRGIDIKFYLKASDALAEIPPVPPITSYNITDDGNFVQRSISVRFEDSTGCYMVKTLYLDLIHPYVMDKLYICDVDNDDKETIDLTKYINKLIPNDLLNREQLSFYEDAGHTKEIKSPITIYSSPVTTVYVRASATTYDSSSCYNDYTVNINLIKSPEVIARLDIKEDNICDNNADGFEFFDAISKISDIYKGTDIVKAEYYDNYNPADRTFSGTIYDPGYIKIYDNKERIIYIKIINAAGCFSVSEIHVTYTFKKDKIILTPAKLDQCSLSSSLEYNLQSAIPLIYPGDTSTFVIEFFKNYDKTRDKLSNPITNLNDIQHYKPGVSDATIYVKFTSGLSNCYSITSIELLAYIPPIVKRGLVFNYCTFNGVDFKQYEDGRLLATFDPKAQYNYTFYTEDPTVNPTAQPWDTSKIYYPTGIQTIWYKASINAILQTNCTDLGNFDLNPDTGIIITGQPFKIDNICDINNDDKENISGFIHQFENDVIKKQYSNATFDYYLSFPNQKITDINTYIFDVSQNQKIYLKVYSGSLCPTIVPIDIAFKKTPLFTLQSPYYFCEFNGSVDIIPDYTSTTALGLSIVNYEWTLPSGDVISGSDKNSLLGIKKAGKYHLKITADNGCTYEEDFEVKTYDVPVITKLIAENNTITVIAEGIASKKILYSKDEVTWQESNIFTNLSTGLHTFYVRYDGIDCIGIPKKDIIPFIANVITPNGDGRNDIWIIKDLYVFDGKEATVKIFDRYNRLIFEQTNSSELKWDGYWLGQPLPTQTFWYIMKFPDGRQFTGFIVVKNVD